MARGSYEVDIEVDILGGPSDRTAEVGSPGGLLCLVVAPTADMRAYVTRGLRSLGHPDLSIRHAATRSGALAAALDGPVLIVLDSEVGSHQETALVEELRLAASGRTRILLLVDRLPRRDTPRLLRKSGADCLLGKPFNLTQLVQEISVLITQVREADSRENPEE